MADPLEFVRDRALTELKDASSTVSQSARTIGIALALVLYSLVFGEDKHGWLIQYRTWLFVAAICGIICVSLDYLQYYCMIWQNRVVLSTLAAKKQAILEKSQNQPAQAELEAEELFNSADTIGDKTKSAYLREACFHLKFVSMAIGVIVMMLVTLWALTSPPATSAPATPSPSAAPPASAPQPTPTR